MKMYQIHNKKLIKTDMKTCWDFFSNPKNLSKITPGEIFKEMNYDENFEMYPGMIISYKVSPFPLINFNWVTEITEVKKFKYFIDEQRFGPYKFWHHQHFFEQKENGIEITDIVNYILPFGIIGILMHILFIQKKLNQIFEYRNKFIGKHLEIKC